MTQQSGLAKHRFNSLSLPLPALLCSLFPRTMDRSKSIDFDEFPSHECFVNVQSTQRYNYMREIHTLNICLAFCLSSSLSLSTTLPPPPSLHTHLPHSTSLPPRHCQFSLHLPTLSLSIHTNPFRRLLAGKGGKVTGKLRWRFSVEGIRAFREFSELTQIIPSLKKRDEKKTRKLAEKSQVIKRSTPICIQNQFVIRHRERCQDKQRRQW